MVFASTSRSVLPRLSPNPDLIRRQVWRVLLSSAAILLTACGGENDPPAPNSETEYVEQEVSERTFNDWTLENVGVEVPVSLGNAADLKIYNDRLFVWDADPMSVKRYALNGKWEVTYGNGQGQGPGQLQHLFSFAVRSAEEVWIVDSRVGDLTRFRYDGTLMENIRTESKPARVAVVGEDRLALLRFRQPKLFALLNANGEVLKRFGKVIDEPQDRYTRILGGQLFPDPSGGFVWAPQHASYLYFYSEDGILERRIELIDRHPFPVEHLRPNPMQNSFDPWPQRTQAVSATDEEIFVNVASEEPLTEDGSGAVAVLDRYDRSTGAYLDSKKIRFGGTNYLVHDGIVYGIAYSDTTLNKLRIHRSP